MPGMSKGFTRFGLMLLAMLAFCAAPYAQTLDRISGVLSAVAIKAPVVVATTSTIILYGYQTIDGVYVTDNIKTTRVPDRVLVKNQTDTTTNGIYDVNSNAWLRSTDFDNPRAVTNGTRVDVTKGLTYAGATFQVSSETPVVFTSSTIVFNQPVATLANLNVTTLTAGTISTTNAFVGNNLSVTTINGQPYGASSTWANLFNKPQVLIDISNSTGSVTVTSLAATRVSSTNVSASVANIGNLTVISCTGCGSGSTASGTITGANQYLSASGALGGDDNIIDNGGGLLILKGVSASIVTATDVYAAANGTGSTPTYTFQGFPTTGMYNTNNTLRFTTGGTLAAQMSGGNVAIHSAGVGANAPLDVYGLISGTSVGITGPLSATSLFAATERLGTGTLADAPLTIDTTSDAVGQIGLHLRGQANTSGTAIQFTNAGVSDWSVGVDGVTNALLVQTNRFSGSSGTLIGYFNTSGLTIGGVTAAGTISAATLTATTISGTNGYFKNISGTALAVGNVSSTGNVQANQFIGDGSRLTGISGSSTAQGDRIVSDTVNSVVAISTTQTISFTAGNQNVAWMTSRTLAVSGSVYLQGMSGLAAPVVTAGTYTSPSWYSLLNIPSLVVAVSNNTYTPSWTAIGGVPAGVANISNSTGSVTVTTVSSSLNYATITSGTYHYGQYASFTTIAGGGAALTGLPVYESVSLTVTNHDDNFNVAGMTSATQTVTELRLTPTSSTSISGFNANGVADGKTLIVRNVTNPTGPGARVLVLERGNTAATYPVNYSPMAMPMFLMPQDEVKLRFSAADQSWNYVEGNRHSSPAQMCDEFNDWAVSANTTFLFSSGTGTSGNAGTTNLQSTPQFVIGIDENGTGSTATGRSYWGSSPSLMRLGAGAALYIGRSYPFQLATGAQNFKTWTGFTNSSAAAMPTAGVAWTYDPSASTTNYRIATFNAAGSTSTTTGAVVSTTQPVKFGVFVNGDSSAAEFFHAISDTITFDGTINTNMPGATDLLGVQTGITKNTGTSAQFWENDYMCWRYQVPRGQ